MRAHRRRQRTVGAGTLISSHSYVRSTAVEKIRSSTSPSVVYSSRTKFSNAEPVLFSTARASAPPALLHEWWHTEEVADARTDARDECVLAPARVDLDGDERAVVAVAHERVRVRLGLLLLRVAVRGDLDAGPPQLSRVSAGCHTDAGRRTFSTVTNACAMCAYLETRNVPRWSAKRSGCRTCGDTRAR
jgi:hypothetical protein